MFLYCINTVFFGKIVQTFVQKQHFVEGVNNSLSSLYVINVALTIMTNMFKKCSKIQSFKQTDGASSGQFSLLVSYNGKIQWCKNFP